jgi:hypothetical protein
MDRLMTDDELRTAYPDLAKRYDEMMKTFDRKFKTKGKTSQATKKWLCRMLVYGEWVHFETDAKRGIKHSVQGDPLTGNRREEWKDPQTGETRIELSNDKTGEKRTIIRPK